MALVLFPCYSKPCISAMHLLLFPAGALVSVSTSSTKKDFRHLEAVQDGAPQMLMKANQRSSIMRSERRTVPVGQYNLPDPPTGIDRDTFGRFTEGMMVFDWQFKINGTVLFPYVFSKDGGDNEVSLHVAGQGLADAQDAAVCHTGSSMTTSACTWQYDYNDRRLKAGDGSLCGISTEYECCYVHTSDHQLQSKECADCSGAECTWCAKLLHEDGRFIMLYPQVGADCAETFTECSKPDEQCRCLSARDKHTVIELATMVGRDRGYNKDTERDCRIRLVSNPPYVQGAWTDMKTNYDNGRSANAGAANPDFTAASAARLEADILATVLGENLITEVTFFAAMNDKIVIPGVNYVWPADELIELAWVKRARLDLAMQKNSSSYQAGRIDARAAKAILLNMDKADPDADGTTHGAEGMHDPQNPQPQATYHEEVGQCYNKNSAGELEKVWGGTCITWLGRPADDECKAQCSNMDDCKAAAVMNIGSQDFCSLYTDLLAAPTNCPASFNGMAASADTDNPNPDKYFAQESSIVPGGACYIKNEATIQMHAAPEFTMSEARAALMQLIPYTTGSTGVIDATALMKGVQNGVIATGDGFTE